MKERMDQIVPAPLHRQNRRRRQSNRHQKCAVSPN